MSALHPISKKQFRWKLWHVCDFLSRNISLQHLLFPLRWTSSRNLPRISFPGTKVLLLLSTKWKQKNEMRSANKLYITTYVVNNVIVFMLNIFKLMRISHFLNLSDAWVINSSLYSCFLFSLADKELFVFPTVLFNFSKCVICEITHIIPIDRIIESLVLSPTSRFIENEAEAWKGASGELLVRSSWSEKQHLKQWLSLI